MKPSKVAPGLYQISLLGVNCFALDAGADGAVLIDAGLPGSAMTIERTLESAGLDVRNILVTHAHSDHVGALSELKRHTGARVWMHRSEARFAAAGRGMRRMAPTPGLVNGILRRVLFARMPTEVAPAETEELVEDRDVIPLAGGIEVIHTPGHSEGHVAFLALALKALFVGDAACNLFGVREMPIYENRRQGLMSLAKLSAFDFEVVCFGHGLPIRRRADEVFRRRWGGGAGRIRP